MSQQNSPWYSYYGRYKGNTPFYFNNDDYDWVKLLEDNAPLIRDEINNFLISKGSSLDQYFNTDIVDKESSWKVGGFYFWGNRIEDNCSYIPELEKLLTSIPGFVSAGISVLDPNSTIKIHNGDTNASIRGHLALKVPAKLPQCGFEVGGIQKSWEEGKIFLFCDAQPHRAWNLSDKTRYVLIFDIIKPEFLSLKKEICSNVLSLIALQQLEHKIPFVRMLPGFARGLIRKSLKKRKNVKLV